MIELIDSHAHLDGAAFDEDRDDVLARARDTGVKTIINIGATDGTQGAQRSIALADRHAWIFASVGIHPHDAGGGYSFSEIVELASHPKVVAIGESGLDFYRDWAPREEQESLFRKHIELAVEVRKPLVVHSREAARECLEMLLHTGIEKVGGVFHCYAEDSAFALELAELNFSVSFPGNLTFPKALGMQEAARDIPLSQILLETDAPYLAPVPFRGKRCESAHLIETAKKLAELKNISLSEVAASTVANTQRLFRLQESK